MSGVEQDRAESANSELSVKEGELDLKCVNSGNPVFTCHSDKNESTREAQTTDKCDTKNYSFYKTTSSTYGLSKPNQEMFPLTYHGKSNQFSGHLMNAGMYRNNSLNTATDKSAV